jgi:hypothetical protein
VRWSRPAARIRLARRLESTTSEVPSTGKPASSTAGSRLSKPSTSGALQCLAGSWWPPTPLGKRSAGWRPLCLAPAGYGCLGRWTSGSAFPPGLGLAAEAGAAIPVRRRAWLARARQRRRRSRPDGPVGRRSGQRLQPDRQHGRRGCDARRRHGGCRGGSRSDRGRHGAGAVHVGSRRPAPDSCPTTCRHRGASSSGMVGASQSASSSPRGSWRFPARTSRALAERVPCTRPGGHGSGCRWRHQ